MAPSLEALITQVATTLMGIDAATAESASQAVLRDLVDYFGVDASFLRHNDHEIRATRLVAEWPPRHTGAGPDPLDLVFFTDADPIFAATETLAEPTIVQPGTESAEYQRHIEVGRNVAATSVAAVPMRSGQVTTGVLGFVKFGDRTWTQTEVNALQAIASLFAQLKARITAEERLRYNADHDELTGLLNRRALFAQLEQRLSASPLDRVPVLYIDLDRFKAINDYLGHDVGDEFLRVFAERLREHTRPADLVARLGGDEFVIIPGRSLPAAETYAEATRIQRAVREYVAVGGESVLRTTSIGVARAVPGLSTPTGLISRADIAVRAAKRAGGDTVTVLDSAMSKRADFRSDVEVHLTAAIDNGDLVLHYQPEVDLRTGQILAVEALVRWQHPTRGLILPGEFMEIAESMNLASPLGHWVLDRACRDFTQWRERGAAEHIVLRINVSPAQLVTHRIVDSVKALLEELGLPGAVLCLEITEHVVVRDLAAIRSTLFALKEFGVHLAIDDFGTGYSVLSHLKDLPIDTLKIDRSFVHNLGNSVADLAIVQAIISLATAFGHDIVAEGVETTIAADILRDLGCHRAQGYLLHPPYPGEDMEALLTRGHIRLPI